MEQDKIKRVAKEMFDLDKMQIEKNKDPTIAEQFGEKQTKQALLKNKLKVAVEAMKTLQMARLSGQEDSAAVLTMPNIELNKSNVRENNATKTDQIKQNITAKIQ